MKTKLPESINTVEEAKVFLTELHKNNETYHPEDDAFDVEWGTTSPTENEKAKLNELMQNIYSLPEMKGYPNCEFDPCGFLLNLNNE